MPNGRFSTFPGLGIQTRRTGQAVWDSCNVCANLNRSEGVRDLTPSTPAVFLPRLSCVTRRTARHLADQELIKSLWSLWIALGASTTWGRPKQKGKKHQNGR